MFESLKRVFGFGPDEDYAGLVKAGAQIVDVRTKEEYRNGHIPGSMNIPLHSLADESDRISKDRPVITCCASGVRSASARTILRAKGYSEVCNGGAWYSLQKKINGQ